MSEGSWLSPYTAMEHMEQTTGPDQNESRRLLDIGSSSGRGPREPAITSAPPAPEPGPASATPVDPHADVGEEGSEPDVDLFVQVDSLLKPVSTTMLLVIALVGVLNASPIAAGAFSTMMVYEEHEDDSAGTKLQGSLENALVFIALIVGVTTLLFLLYKFHCTKIIYAWLITSVGMLLGSFGGLVA